jgi:hypothetical protein
MVYHLYILPRRLSLYASKELLYITLATRVARWYIFKPKIPNWVNLQWNILVYFMAIWSIFQPFGILYSTLVFLWSFGISSPFWYVVPRKIWQPCWLQKRQRIEAFGMLNFYGFLMTVKSCLLQSYTVLRTYSVKYLSILTYVLMFKIQDSKYN